MGQYFDWPSWSLRAVMAESSEHQTDEELFGRFVELIRAWASDELKVVIQISLVPNNIEWGEASSPHLYSFDPQRAHDKGIGTIADEAVARIRSDPP